MAGWRFVLTDNGWSSLGELRAFNRSLAVGVSQTAVATCTIRQDDVLWPAVIAGQTKLKVYNSANELVCAGPVVTDDETATSGGAGGGGAGGAGAGCTVAISAVDQSWELSKRFFAGDASGVGIVYALTDSGAIAFDILAKANAVYATGITAGTADPFVARTVTYLWKNVLQAVNELGGIQGSYEWGLRYVDGTPPTIYLDLATVMGTDRHTTVFLEYGTGKANCSRYEKVRSIDDQATYVWANGSGGLLTAVAYDAGAEATYSMRREDVVSYGDISDGSILVALAAENVALRKDPYQIVSMSTLPQKGPKYGVDYNLGDYVGARAVVAGKTRVSGTARVWAATISIDELGSETPSLSLIPSTQTSLP